MSSPATDAQTILLPYGREPLALRREWLPVRTDILTPPNSTPVEDIASVARAALAHPFGCPRLRERVRRGMRLCVLIPDATRAVPRAEMLQALWAELDGICPPREMTYIVATGTHRGNSPDELGLEAVCAERGIELLNHDARCADELTTVGTTSRGTPVTLNRHAVEADMRIVLGQIQPHYFAGATGGAKGLYPGVAGLDSIRANHRLKAEPTARLGVVEGNSCRADMEAAARLAGEAFMLNVALDGRGRVSGAVAGDLIAAHRAGVDAGRGLWEVVGRRADIVLISAGLPMAANLYQLCKLVAPAGWMVRPGGCIIVAGECPDGVGGMAAVNQQIYEWGLRYYLPPHVRCTLVSGLSREDVEATFFEYAASLEGALQTALKVVESGGVRERRGAARALGAAASATASAFVRCCVIPYGGGIIPLIVGR